MHVSVYAFEPQSVLTYQTDAQGAIKNLTAGHNDLTIYSTAYGRLLMIQLSVQNQDLLDVYWFLARLHLTAHIDTWPDPTAYEHKQPPFPGLDQTQVFLHVCVFSLSLYGFLYVCAWASASFSDRMSACLLYVLSCPLLQWSECTEWRSVPRWALILGCRCVMCLGFWQCRRCDVYLCLWGMALTGFFFFFFQTAMALVTVK